jgi:hypothetical protein
LKTREQNGHDPIARGGELCPPTRLAWLSGMRHHHTMALAIFRRSNGWVTMLCMAMTLALAGNGAVLAFDAGDHAGHHAAETMADADSHHCEDDPGNEPAEPAGEPHHHHADHHSVTLGLDVAGLALLATRRGAIAPAHSVRQAGLSGYGIERPPKG